MNKKLLLLGILLSHDMHGYELSEILKYIGIPIEMKKSNAYRLLGVLEKDELITFTNEQVGNRPVRRVYSITEKGEKEFQRLLRENLAAYTEPDFPSLIGIDFIHLLPAEEAVALLEKRLKLVEAKKKAFEALPKETVEEHKATPYLKAFYAQEIAWLKEFIDHLKV